MKDNLFKKIIEHPDKDEIVAKLVLGIENKEINQWLKNKYQDVKDRSLIVSITNLKLFKDEYLDLYNTIRDDALKLQNTSTELAEQDPKKFIAGNNAYRQKLEEYIDKEIDIRSMVKNLIIAANFRIEQIFDMIQSNPGNTKPDYVLIQWMQTLANILEKQESLINGNSEKNITQNNINIQIVDQQIGVIQEAIREVISQLDYDTSLLFIEAVNKRMSGLKPSVEEAVPVDVRLTEAKRLTEVSTSEFNS